MLLEFCCCWGEEEVFPIEMLSVGILGGVAIVALLSAATGLGTVSAFFVVISPGEVGGVLLFCKLFPFNCTPASAASFWNCSLKILITL